VVEFDGGIKMKGLGEAAIIAVLVFVATTGTLASLAFGPTYNVWASEMAGKAELAQAQYNRQIAVTEAEAKLESAKSLAAAEVERARGVAQANKIIGESLKENEDYLRYLWITDVAGANIDKTVVYVPTETNLPILEATRARDI
jgi:regulator of protease activity HflC (stomatin/prohibitin superfamily)